MDIKENFYSKLHNLREENLDEAKKDSKRVVTASKKAEKGTKWKVISRNPDSEGSDVELRQGKRRKMAGGFYRDSQDFGLLPTKKGKMDMKAKSKYFDNAKDILKTVKEENINEVSQKKATDAYRNRLAKMHNKLDESSEEEKRQKRLSKFMPKEKKKKLGKNAELVAGWKDEINQVRSSMRARQEKK
jgi:hypothetical protein